MGNKNIVIVKHHPRPLTLSNPFYLTQCPDIEDRVIINTPVGHAFVVKALLQGDLQVVDGEVLDPLGMLAA
jgi:hypothetical protein